MNKEESFVGQRLFSAVTDLAFFVLIGVFGTRKIIGEVLIGTLLSSYAAYRFGVSQGKQQAVAALASSGAFPSAGGGSGSSHSGPTRRMSAMGGPLGGGDTPDSHARMEGILAELAHGR